jgi:hypothetical protein
VPTEAVLRSLVELEPAAARLPVAAPLRIVRVWSVGRYDGLYDLEAQRTVTRVDNCHGLSLFRAWFRVGEEQRVSVVSREYEASDCDTKGAHFYEPLGIIVLGSVRYVVVQRNGWEEQAFGVLRIDAASVKTMVMTDIR